MPIRQIVFLAAATAGLAGCKVHEVRDPDYGQVTWAAEEAQRVCLSAEVAVSPISEQLSGPQPLGVFVTFALSQNASVQAARKRVEAAALRIPQAASLKDPMLDVIGWPFYPNVPQTASGRMTVDLMVSQEVPWFGKLRTKVEAARQELNTARAELAAAELKTIEEVRRAYYELFFVQQAIGITERDRAALGNLVEVANTLYTTGTTSQQDVLRLQAELSNVDGELIRLRQMRASAQAELARLLHISPETPLAAVDRLPQEDVPGDLESLYQQAITARPELHAMLAEIERDRRMVELARLEYYPDATFQLGWGEMTTNRAIAPTADGIDNVTVGLAVNLPVYRQRLNAAVREAESTAVATARQYDQMRDETQRDVKQLFTQATTQQELEHLFRESIIPKTEQAFEIAVRGYQVGEVDFADLIANWRELLRFHVAHVQLQAQLRQTLASLERLVGGLRDAPPETIPAPHAGQQKTLDPPDPLPEITPITSAAYD
jgi:outer membrane protein TolC